MSSVLKQICTVYYMVQLAGVNYGYIKVAIFKPKGNSVGNEQEIHICKP